MNSKLFIFAGYGAWYFTFLLGFFILAPSTDDGFYIVASMGTALTGSPGFWIGDEFSHVFFLPTAFTFFYGFLLKLTMISGLDFGPFGFRFYQFLFILLVPVVSSLMLRRLFPGDHGIRLLLFLTLLSVTHFVQSASTVRPEVLGSVLFILFLALREKKFAGGALPAFILALSGTVHPIFTLLAVAVFGVGLVRKYQQTRLKNLSTWLGTLAGFAVPFGLLGIYYLFNLTEFREQTLGRAGFLAADGSTAPAVILNNLQFWNNPAGIEFGLFSGYPAIAFVLIMLASTALVIYRRADLWGHESLWLCWPILFAAWFVFLFLPAFLPYLAFSSILASLIVVLLLRPVRLRLPSARSKWLVAGGGFALCLVFIAFQGGKFLLTSEDRLTPAGLHSVMSPILENPETKLYTNAARLIPPLIDHFSKNGNIRLNLTYLSPDCFQPVLLDRANRHALTVLVNTDPLTTYWGLDLAQLEPVSNQAEDGELRFVTSGSHSTIALIPADEIYVDNKNSIIRATSVRAEIDEFACAD